MKKLKTLIHSLEKDLFKLLIFRLLFDLLKLFFLIKRFIGFSFTLFVRNFQLHYQYFYLVHFSYFSKPFKGQQPFNPHESFNFQQQNLQETQPILNEEFTDSFKALFISCHFRQDHQASEKKVFHLFRDQFSIHRKSSTSPLAN